MRHFVLTIVVVSAWILSSSPSPGAADIQPRPSYEKQSVGERPSDGKPRPRGEIDFEKFRMLDTGMTQAEIMARVGDPKQIFRIGHNVERWVYTTDDEWLIEITFTSGRVANIDRYRPRP